MDNGLKLALNFFKSRHAMAIAINSNPAKGAKAWRSAVYAWKQIPPHHCARVAELIGASPKDLRPDVFGEPAERAN